MEKLQEHNRQFIDKIIACVKEFYGQNPIAIDREVDFMFKKRANTQNIEEALLKFNENHSLLSLPEKELVSMYFSKPMLDYLRTKFIDDTDGDWDEYDMLVDFFRKVQELFAQTQQESIVSDICEEIAEIIKSGEQVSKMDFIQNKWALEWEVRGKLVRVLWGDSTPILLMETADYNQFFLDVNNAKILHDCGDLLECTHAFGDSRLYIFDKQEQFTRQELEYHVHKKLLQIADFTIGEFLEYIKDRYSIQADFGGESEDREIMEKTPLDTIYSFPQLFKWIMQIINKFGYKQKRIFLESNWEVSNLWSYDSYKQPETLASQYKWFSWAKIEVKNHWDKKVIVTNGREVDIFDI